MPCFFQPITTQAWQFVEQIIHLICDQVDRASGPETVDSGSTPDRVKPKAT